MCVGTWESSLLRGSAEATDTGSSPNGTVRDKACGRAESTAEMASTAHLNSLNFSL